MQFILSPLPICLTASVPWWFAQDSETHYDSKCMTWKIIATLLSLLAGGWMITDGIHCMIRDKYIGPEKPGPWSAIFTSLGMNPFKIAPLFVLLGILWIAGLAFLLLSSPPTSQKAWTFSIAVAIGSLWYFPVGTILSIAYILLLSLCKSPFVQ